MRSANNRKCQSVFRIVQATTWRDKGIVIFFIPLLHCYIVNKDDQEPAEVEEQPFKHQHWPRTAENDQRLPS